MNERQITEKVLADVRINLRGAVVLKHADRFTRGIPDFSVSVLGGTTWVEMKYLRAGMTLREAIDTVQLTLCHQLATVTNGRCWIVVYEDLGRAVPRSPKKGRVTVWTPRALFAHLWPKFDAGVDRPQWMGREGGCAPVELPDLEQHVSYAATLFSHGAIRINEWHYGVVTKLITEAVAR